mmetsp:Transcript_63604/g.124886  ORF Transcript_63604/g.124886 Transcript_63604/m.124886 type:complete len:239 (-) Transcript_63604:673-1389(-)
MGTRQVHCACPTVEDVIESIRVKELEMLFGPQFTMGVVVDYLSIRHDVRDGEVMPPKKILQRFRVLTQIFHWNRDVELCQGAHGLLKAGRPCLFGLVAEWPPKHGQGAPTELPRRKVWLPHSCKLVLPRAYPFPHAHCRQAVVESPGFHVPQPVEQEWGLLFFEGLTVPYTRLQHAPKVVCRQEPVQGLSQRGDEHQQQWRCSTISLRQLFVHFKARKWKRLPLIGYDVFLLLGLPRI